jgi:hypothetical protein
MGLQNVDDIEASDMRGTGDETGQNRPRNNPSGGATEGLRDHVTFAEPPAA